MEHDTSSILIYRARDSIEGALLKAMLEEHDIEAWTSGGQSAIGFGELGSDALLVDIRIRARHALEARRLIGAFWRDRGTAGAGPWTCGLCGEGNETGYEACWSCGATRPLQDRAVGATDSDLECPAAASRWSSWEVRAARVWLAIGSITMLAIACTLIARTVTPALFPLLRELGIEDGSPWGSQFIVVFLAFWLPGTVLIVRWMLARARAVSDPAEAS